MDISIYTLLFLIAAGFLAAFIDSVVGGGGLISTPALLFVGLPPSTAIATNKLASAMGSLTSTLSFVRSGHVNISLVMKLFPLTFVGSVIGASVTSYLPPEVLRPIALILLICVAIFTIMRKNWGQEATFRSFTVKVAIIFAAIIFVVGFYDGILGAGTGSFLLFAFLFVGFDFLQSAGNAKVLNFGSNIAALLVFLLLGEVNFLYGLPMGLAMVAGALVGSNFAIKRGVSYIRKLFIIVTIILIGKNVYDYLSSLM